MNRDVKRLYAFLFDFLLKEITMWSLNYEKDPRSG
jgi:hypothetical protein